MKEILVMANEAYRDLVDLHEHYLAKKTVIVNTDEEDGKYLVKADEVYYEIIRLEGLYKSQTKET